MASKIHDQIPNEWVRSHLRDGKFLIMFDGLDEIADEDLRRRAIEWVESQIGSFSKNQYIVTSRPGGYIHNPMVGFNELRVLPFNMEQVRKFAKQWYCTHELDRYHSKINDGKITKEQVIKNAEITAGEMLKAIYSRNELAEFASNPLLLTFMARLHNEDSYLPEKRIDLYRETFNLLISKRDIARGIDRQKKADVNRGEKIEIANKLKLLQLVAYNMMIRYQTVISIEQAAEDIRSLIDNIADEVDGRGFLEMIAESSIFVEREGVNEWEFAHKTFQEFLAATHIAENSILGQSLFSDIGKEWWFETALFYAAQSDATKLVEACLVKMEPISLALASQCYIDALQLGKKTKQKVRAVLDEGVENIDENVRQSVAFALLHLRKRGMRRLNEITEIDDRLINHAEYQLFIDQNPQYHPLHWATKLFPKGKGDSPLMGVTKKQAKSFCEWLSSTEQSGVWRYRLPRRYEIDDDLKGYWLDDSWSFFGEQVHYADLPERAVKQVNDDIGSYDETGTYRHSRYSQSEIELGAYIYLNVMISNLDSALTQIHARSFDLVRALDLTRARIRAHGLSYTLSSTLDLNRSLDQVIEYFYAFDPNLAHTLNSDHALNLKLAHALDLNHSFITPSDLNSTRARDIISARDIINPNDLAVARDIARALDIDLDLARAFDIDLARAFENAHTSARDLARARALDIVSASAIVRTIARELVSVRDIARTLSDIDSVLEESFAKLQVLYVRLGLKAEFWTLDFPMKRSVLRQNARYAALAGMGNMITVWRESESLNQGEQEEVKNLVHEMVQAYIDYYVQLVILEGRVNGEYEAFEGIRIVRERITPDL